MGTRHAAAGALAALAGSSDRWLAEVVPVTGPLGGRVLAAAAALAVHGGHARTQLEAVRLIACAARAPQHAARLWAAAGPALVDALLRGRSASLPGPATAAAEAGPEPAWTGQRALRRTAALALKALIEPSAGSAEAAAQARRLEVLQLCGGFAQLLVLAAPASAARDGSCCGDPEMALAAAAVLRFVALVPDAAQALLGEWI